MYTLKGKDAVIAFKDASDSVVSVTGIRGVRHELYTYQN